MKVFISIDMEGISGVFAEAHTTVGTPEYSQACRWMRADLDAAVEGCLEAGATEILVADGHDHGANVSFEGLPPAVRLASGSPSPLSMMHGIDETFDAAVFLGYHARAGTLGAVLEHTYSYDVFQVTIGDIEAGETAMNGAVAGALGVPLVFVSGDDKLALEAKALIPGVGCAVVKEGGMRTSARLLPQDATLPAIRAGLRDALRATNRPAPLILDGQPMRVTFQRTGHCDLVCGTPGVERLDARTVEIALPSYLETFDAFIVCMRLAAMLR